MRTSMDVAPGERVEVPVSVDGWPFRVHVGGVKVPAFPEKRRGRKGRVDAVVRFTVPEGLGRGSHDLTVSGGSGTVLSGTLNVRS